MAINQGFMSQLQAGAGGVTSQTKKNPYAQEQQMRTASSGPTPGNSPVTASGTINPNNPPKTQSAPSPNQMATGQQQQQGQAPGSPGPGWTQGANGGWLPPGHPAAGGQGQQGQQMVPGLATPGYMQYLQGLQSYQGTNMGQHQNITYDPTQVNMQMPNMYGPYTQYRPETQLPTQGYQAGQITQYQGPNQQAVQDQQQQLLMGMLQNPYSMSDQNVEQLKAQQRATALALQQAGQSTNAEQAAAMGRVGGSGQRTADARLADSTNSNILSGYRDIALNKMKQDRQDLLDAIEGATGVMDSASQRSTQEYAQGLAGQQARELGQFNQAKSAQDLAALGLDRDALLQKENQFAFGTEQQRFLDQLKANQLGLDVEKFNAGENWNATQSAQTNQQQALQRAIAQAGDNQNIADSGMKLGGMLQDSWNQQAGRELQDKLAQAGFGIDRDKIAQTGNIAKMDNSTRLMDILLGHQRGMAGLNQNDSQFNKTFGLQQQDQQNKLMQWLFPNL